MHLAMRVCLRHAMPAWASPIAGARKGVKRLGVQAPLQYRVARDRLELGVVHAVRQHELQRHVRHEALRVHVPARGCLHACSSVCERAWERGSVQCMRARVGACVRWSVRRVVQGGTGVVQRWSKGVGHYLVWG